MNFDCQILHQPSEEIGQHECCDSKVSSSFLIRCLKTAHIDRDIPSWSPVLLRIAMPK